MPINVNESKELRFNTKNTNLADATVKKILYQKPSGATGFWSASYNGTKLVYTTVDGDLDEAGQWFFQPYVEFAGGIIIYGETVIEETVIQPIL